MMGVNGIPEPFIEKALVFLVSQIAAEIEREMSIHDRSDKTFFPDSLRRESFKPFALERIGSHKLLVAIIDRQPVIVMHPITSFVIPARALKGERRQNFMATVTEGIGVSRRHSGDAIPLSDHFRWDFKDIAEEQFSHLGGVIEVRQSWLAFHKPVRR